MVGGDHLRECLRLGAVRFVAASADHRRVRKLRLHGCGVAGVPGLSAVTGLAGDVHVTAKFFLVDNVSVAALADFVTRESRSASGDLSDGVAAVMSVLAKTPGDNGGAENNEEQQRQKHHGCEADEMFDVLEHVGLSGPEWGSGSGTLRHVI